nr:4Fe-4S binding protein [Desulfobacterales bacterium]
MDQIKLDAQRNDIRFMKFRFRKDFWIVAGGLLAALALPLLFGRVTEQPRTHIVELKAEKYGYTPARITVNRGDTVIFKPTSMDVTHGFLLDGYDLELVIKQQGINFLKYTWEDEDGALQTDWDKVSEVELIADRAGKFTFRCTQTCGNLHPFMTGELIVRPNTPYYLMVSLSIWIVLGGLYCCGRTGSDPNRKARRVNLFQLFPWLKRIVRSRSFQFGLIFPGFVIFYLFILSSLWGSPVGNRNIAIIFVWILWWFILKAVLIPLGGRLWCMVCPLPAPAEWLSRRTLAAVRYIPEPLRRLHHRFTGLQKDWPRRWQSIWLQNILFMTMISFGIILITRPFATATMFLGILALTLILAVFFRQRVFCLYLCPVGGFLGTYSMASMTELRAIDADVCRHHKTKCCVVGSPDGWACPWNQYIGKMRRNNACGLCMECVKSCPQDNIGLFLRPFGSDRLLRGYDELFNVVIMLVVAVAFSITMVGPWGVVKNAA